MTMFPPRFPQRPQSNPAQAAATLQQMTAGRNSSAAFGPGMAEEMAGMGSSQFAGEQGQLRANERQQGMIRSNALAGAETKRDIAFDDQAAEDYDTQYRGPQRQAVMNRLGDSQSEAVAGRQFLPQAQALYDRTRRGQMQDAETRYLQPAQIKADTDLEVEERRGAATMGAADIRAQGDVTRGGVQGEATQRAALIRGLLGAMSENDPNVLRLFQQLFPDGQPQQPQQ